MPQFRISGHLLNKNKVCILYEAVQFPIIQYLPVLHVSDVYKFKEYTLFYYIFN